MNKATLNKMGASIMDVAKSIAKDIYPGMPALTGEANVVLRNNQTKEVLASMLRKTDMSKPQILKTLSGSQDEVVEKVATALSESTGAPLDAMQNVVNKKAQRAAQEAEEKTVEQLSKKSEKAMTYVQAYYSNPDKKVRDRRIGATVAAASAVAVGGRYLSGGTLTTDNYGRKDIAGIPFL